jgi:hypothetical protein
LYPGYPEKPPFEPEDYEELKWYHNESEGWGCWVENLYKGPLMIPKSFEDAKRLPGMNNEDPYYKGYYRSPIPLHCSDVPNSFRAHMTWHVNENGYGQYVYVSRKRNPETGRFESKHISVTKYYG